MTQYEIESRCNEYIGYPPEADEGLDVHMRRKAFIAGCNQVNEKLEELIRLVGRMREAQCKANNLFCDMEWWHYRANELETEVDEYLKKMGE